MCPLRRFPPLLQMSHLMLVSLLYLCVNLCCLTGILSEACVESGFIVIYLLFTCVLSFLAGQQLFNLIIGIPLCYQYVTYWSYIDLCHKSYFRSWHGSAKSYWCCWSGGHVSWTILTTSVLINQPASHSSPPPPATASAQLSQALFLIFGIMVSTVSNLQLSS